MLAHVRDAAAGPLSPVSAERIFSLIIEETTAVQEEAPDDDGDASYVESGVAPESSKRPEPRS